MRNLVRLTNAANNIEARNDWQKQVNRAWAMGRGGLVAVIIARYKIIDADMAPWRRLDKALVDLRTRLDALEPVGETGAAK